MRPNQSPDHFGGVCINQFSFKDAHRLFVDRSLLFKRVDKMSKGLREVRNLKSGASKPGGGLTSTIIKPIAQYLVHSHFTQVSPF